MRDGVRSGIYDSRIGELHTGLRELTTTDLVVMHLPRRYWDARLRLMSEDSKAREILNRFESDVVQVMSTGKPSMFWFFGESKTGKTSAAAIMAKIASAHRYMTFFLSASDIQNHFRNDKLTEDEYHTTRDRAYSTDLLVLDGFGRGSSITNPFAKADIEALLSHRQSALKPTIVTTTVNGEELKRVFSNTFQRTVLEDASFVRFTEVREAVL